MPYRVTTWAKMLLALCLFVIISCAPTRKSGLMEGKYPNGIRRYTIEVDENGIKNGKETWWFQNGKMKYEAINVQGFREGPYTSFFENGQVWYKGQDKRGRLDGEVVYYHPNGQIRSKALFRDGMQLQRDDFDENGKALGPSRASLAEEMNSQQKADSISAAKERQMGIEDWSRRIKATVETYWVIPKEIQKGQPLRSVAVLRIRRTGELMSLKWNTRSESKVFDRLAENAVKKVRRFPEFPSNVPDSDLSVQYEFVSGGKAPPRERLQLRGGNPPLNEGE